jgi:hypothetical protein
VNQKLNGGSWNVLGRYWLKQGVAAKVTITARPGPSSTCADAIRFAPASFNSRPVAVIESVTPSSAAAGENVEFVAKGLDTDGSVVAFEWSSSIDGQLSKDESFSTTELSEGVHTVTLRAVDSGNVILRANIVRTLGTLAGGQAVKQLLVEALNDRNFVIDDEPERQGDPLRICDMAYNQLVLRYQLRDVLRAISTAHKIDERDYHIQQVKGLL